MSLQHRWISWTIPLVREGQLLFWRFIHLQLKMASIWSINNNAVQLGLRNMELLNIVDKHGKWRVGGRSEYCEIKTWPSLVTSRLIKLSGIISPVVVYWLPHFFITLFSAWRAMRHSRNRATSWLSTVVLWGRQSAIYPHSSSSSWDFW